MTVKTIKTDRNADTAHFELDYANGICRDLTVAAGQLVIGPFAGSLVYIMPTGGDVSVRGDGIAANAYGDGTITVISHHAAYVPLDAGKTMSIVAGYTLPAAGLKINAIPVKAT